MNIKDSVSNLKIKDLNINYIDLNKLNFLKNKNPDSYYMINGSRKINLPEVSDMSEASAKNIFSEVSPLSENTLSGGVNKSGKKKFYKKDLSSTSFTFSDATETAKNVNITSVSGGGSSSSSTTSKKSSSSSSSSSTQSEKMSRQRNRYEDMSYNAHLDTRTKSKLDRLPDNYFDLAPDHLLNGMQNMPQGDMGMPQGNMGMPQGNMGMPQGDMGMPQGNMGIPQGDMGMPQMAPPMQMGLPQMPMGMGQIPPMPADMQQAAMNNGVGPQMHPQLNVPMMNNPMANFMGMGQGMGPGMQMGGSSQPLQKYKLTLDKFFFWKIIYKVVEQRK